MNTLTLCVVLVITFGVCYGQGFDFGYGGEYEDYHHPANYQFGYGVADPTTGDYKQQREVREGDIVKGQYSLKEPDGTTRLVEYVAGPQTGFNAVVKKLGHAHHPLPHHSYGQGGGSGFGGEVNSGIVSGIGIGSGSGGFGIGSGSGGFGIGGGSGGFGIASGGIGNFGAFRGRGGFRNGLGIGRGGLGRLRYGYGGPYSHIGYDYHPHY